VARLLCAIRVPYTNIWPTRTMKVLFWSELFWPYIGGAEVFGAKLLRALATRKNQFAVITSHDTLDLPDCDSYEGIPVYRFPFRAVLSGRALNRFQEVIQGVARVKAEFQPDLVHLNALGPSATFHVRAAGNGKVPTLFTLQQEVLPSQTGSGSLLYQLLSAAARVVGVSQSVLEQVRNLAPQISPKASCIYNGVEPPPVFPSPLPFHPPRLLCLGRLVPAKRIEWALEVVSRLRDRFPGLALLIAGDGPLRGVLEARAVELGVRDCVRFLGWVEPENVYETLNQATCVLMPSLREGLPVAGVQAAMMGRPIVATSAGGLVEVVRHPESGLLVELDDLEGFVSAVGQLLENPERAAHMGAAARAHALRTFEWTSTVESYQHIYNDVAGNGAAGDFS
jgi:glycosyltransferase involved in cell wall biosynthesis